MRLLLLLLQVRHVFTQLVRCVEHMHDTGVLHADLKVTPYLGPYLGLYLGPYLSLSSPYLSTRTSRYVRVTRAC